MFQKYFPLLKGEAKYHHCNWYFPVQNGATPYFTTERLPEHRHFYLTPTFPTAKNDRLLLKSGFLGGLLSL